MTSPLVNLEAAHVACLNEALRQAPVIIERWRTEVANVLNERYVSSLQNIDKKHLRAAMLALQKHHVTLGKTFVAALTSAMASDPDTVPIEMPAWPRKRSSSLTFDEMELMGDNQVQDTVDVARVLQTMAMKSEAGLAAFSARMSTTQGFAQVEAEKNPLRPEVFSRALLKAAQSVPVDNAIRSLWFTHGGALMGQQLQNLYVSLNEILVERAVIPAAYRVLTANAINTANPTASRSIATGLGASVLPPQEVGKIQPLASSQGQSKTDEVPVSTPSRTQLRVNRLRTLLVGDEESTPMKAARSFDSEAIAYQDFGHTLPGALSVLDELEQHSTETDPTSRKPLGTRVSPFAQLRERLKFEAKSLGQSLAIDVVSLMFEKIADDSRLLVTVQQIIATVEPAYLQLAVTDPRFFSDKSHPARSLLEAMTSESLAFTSESSQGFSEFLEQVQSVTKLLTQDDNGDATDFDSLLTDFKKKAALRHAAAREIYRRTDRALLEVELRQVVAQKIAEEILGRPDFVARSRSMTAFISGPWSQVLAKERMAADADKSGMYKAIFSLTLGELLWSLNTDKTAPHPKRLAKLIPSLLDRLHGGLASIGSPLAEHKAFFKELLTIYQSSLKSSGQPVMSNATQASSARNRQPKIYSNGVFGSGNSAYGISSWLALLEAEHSGDVRESAHNEEPQFQGTQPFQDTAFGEKPDPQAQTAQSAAGGLRLGAWIELIEDDLWVRAQLTWTSLYNALFIFTSTGGRTHPLSEPLLHHLMLQGQIKVISHEGVLAGTLNQVAQNQQT